MNSAPLTAATATPAPLLLARSAIGGLLMGLANLVPGISGGTMLLAAGVYTFFIDAIAEITTFKFRKPSLIVLGGVVAAAALAILLLAGPVKNLVVDRRWIMYSLFIGLTLGGIPILWKMIGRPDKGVGLGALAGFLLMAALALAQQHGAGTEGSGAGSFIGLFVAGVAGASAMILPGVSGGYLLLVLGQYIPILSGIDAFKEALRAVDIGAIFSVGFSVILPVGLGVLVGVVLISNLLRFVLHRFEKPTLGVLLGLLLGAVVGLWPFQEGIPPVAGDTIKGSVLTEESAAEVKPDDWPTAFFRPTASQWGGALGLILGGFLCTVAVSRIGGNERPPVPRQSAPEAL